MLVGTDIRRWRKLVTFTICWACILVCAIGNIVLAEEAVSSHGPFADFGYLPPPGSYSGRIFHLSQQYPKELPNNLPEFFKIDFRKEWREYLLAARDYCFSGNIGGKDVEDDFDMAHRSPFQWYHMPWQHFGPFGREGIHGLTKEAPVSPGQLAWTQHSKGQTYAVAFYNAYGGHLIGKVWDDPDKPELHDIRFPKGTVVFKLLFVDIPTNEVPSLSNPVQWKGYVTDNFESTQRAIHVLSLIQMDLMVRDEQSPLGWIFGTFQYNGQLNRANRWKNLVPLGIQWGNDPDVTDHQSNPQPVKTVRNTALRETVVNSDEHELPPTHLGWNGRLNGPVDNPMSSCMSCHATAQVREKSPLSPLFQNNPPVPGSTDWMRWFKNYKCGEQFDEGIPSTDFSLQLAISVKNFQQWKAEARGFSAKNYEFLAGKAARSLGQKYSDTIIENGVPTEAPKIQRNIAE
jgi:hypothetical protein